MKHRRAVRSITTRIDPHFQLRLPRHLEEAAREPRNTKLAAWVGTLPSVVAELVDRWSLEVFEPYEPGGMCSWVAPAKRADGSDAVLKVGFRHSEAEHEAEALRLWNGDGAARLFDSYKTPNTHALLLERCEPGTLLSQAVSEKLQDEVIASLLRRLHREPPAGHSFRPLQAMCDRWADEAERKALRKSEAIDPGLLRAGLGILRTLGSTASRSVVLCTDLHAGNVLAARREPWLVVDPKPYVGDPAYDVVQHLLNCLDRVEQDPHGMSTRMADLLEVPAERVKGWLFARCVQEAVGDDVWAARLGGIARRLAP